MRRGEKTTWGGEAPGMRQVLVSQRNLLRSQLSHCHLDNTSRPSALETTYSATTTSLLYLQIFRKKKEKMDLFLPCMRGGGPRCLSHFTMSDRQQSKGYIDWRTFWDLKLIGNCLVWSRQRGRIRPIRAKGRYNEMESLNSSIYIFSPQFFSAYQRIDIHKSSYRWNYLDR